MHALGSDINGPQEGSSSAARAPKNSNPVPPSRSSMRRRRRSVIARIGAEPVPEQIISRLEPGWFGMRKLVPNGPTTCTVSPFARSQRKFDATPRAGFPS